MKIFIRFNEAQLKQLADICANFSVLFFGTVFAPLFTGVDPTPTSFMPFQYYSYTA